MAWRGVAGAKGSQALRPAATSGAAPLARRRLNKAPTMSRNRRRDATRRAAQGDVERAAGVVFQCKRRYAGPEIWVNGTKGRVAGYDGWTENTKLRKNERKLDPKAVRSGGRPVRGPKARRGVCGDHIPLRAVVAADQPNNTPHR